MISDALLYVMMGAIVVSAIAMVFQAVFLLGVYKASKATRDQTVLIAGHVESFVESTQRSLEQSRRQVSEVATKTGAVLDLTYKQLVRIDEVLGEATSRARIQMDRVELILDDTLTRLHETTALLNKGILRPIREINGVAAGIQAALACLFSGRRLTVERATHDDEMFI
jgi:hypothetical protein